MIRKPWKLSWIPALLVALVIAACGDQAGRGTEVVGPDEPSYSTSLVRDYQAMKDGSAVSYAGSTEKVIDQRGGYVYLDLHYLYVPAGAVSRPTTFRMETLGNGDIGAKMTATSVGSLVKNDAGAIGFRTPVYLYFSYARATNVPSDPMKLKVGELLASGFVQIVPTVVYPQYKVAGGTLRHFSDYSLIFP